VKTVLRYAERLAASEYMYGFSMPTLYM